MRHFTIQPQTEEFVEHKRRFHWETLLPRRQAWIQTLILLPFGLSVGNFLGASFNFSMNLIVIEGQILTGIISMAFNLVLPTIFFAVLYHWGWFIWQKQDSPAAWYPNGKGLWAGCYATLTIAVSFGLLRLVTQYFGACNSPGWGEIGQAMLCNLDSYGFESKPSFGAWFIVAAYCYKFRDAIESCGQRLFRRQSRTTPSQLDRGDLGESIDYQTAADHGPSYSPLDSDPAQN